MASLLRFATRVTRNSSHIARTVPVALRTWGTQTTLAGVTLARASLSTVPHTSFGLVRRFSTGADPLDVDLHASPDDSMPSRITFDKVLAEKYGWNEEEANKVFISPQRPSNNDPHIHAHAVYDAHRKRRDYFYRYNTPPIYESRYPDIEIPANEHLGRFILYNLARQPKDSIAAVNAWTGESITFHALHNQILKAANALIARHGLENGDKFAILLPNDIQYMVAFPAIVTANAVVTTINPTYTAKEVCHQMEDCGARFILTHSSLLTHVLTEPPTGLAKIFLVDDLPDWSQYEFADEESELSTKAIVHRWSDLQDIPWEDCTHTSFERNTLEHPDRDMANFDGDRPVVIPYSSGTTGLPKGVVLSHNNLLANLMQTAAAEYDLADGHETLQAILPFFHIYGMIVILLTSLMRGLKVVVHPKFDLEMFLKSIEEQKCTIAHIAPPIAVALAKHPLVTKYDLSSLKCIFSGAAPLSPETEMEVFRRVGVRMKQGYGMTELSPVSHINPSFMIKPGSVGVLVPNTEAKILDIESGAPLGVGQEGEICIRGPQVMLGYLNNAKATYDTIDTDGFLHTGDIGKIDEDGFFYVVDRVKELIKYKGYQVAPAELEALILTHDAVADVAVVPVPEEAAGELPRAYVVLKSGQTLDAETLNLFLEDKIAHYKRLRGGVAFIDAIPKSASGKILRRVLRDQALVELGIAPPPKAVVEELISDDEEEARDVALTDGDVSEGYTVVDSGEDVTEDETYGVEYTEEYVTDDEKAPEK